MSRAITKEEARETFLEQIKTIVDYWSELEQPKSVKDRCDGVAFSILAMIDGCSVGIPALDISISPHPDDKQYHIDNGENWYEDGMVINDDCLLHEIMHR